ncbi:hypothetical protein CAPTEDRAFT_207935 [Capitella teleta]|uniref:DNA-directed DNA polymerase n=1 Tax=Capitella teleta TaxID=283909 RepID=R7VKS3_CAPTE|nr:hypothetical protein CAPTEDRAFT_207935 [Capitella teleta]|eukprot:ELU17621.1 hypothetical protein CAPTEDRAFT_207935 [Capitella teleta]
MELCAVNHDSNKKLASFLKSLKAKFERFLSEMIVFGFNSGKYDLNVIKKQLFGAFAALNKKVIFVVRKNNNYICIKTHNLKILDIVNYLAPGFSYAKYLKAFNCSVMKGYFPYEWLDSYDKLAETSLPPKSAFYSTLTKERVSATKRDLCERAGYHNAPKASHKRVRCAYTQLSIVYLYATVLLAEIFSRFPYYCVFLSFFFFVENCWGVAQEAFAVAPWLDRTPTSIPPHLLLINSPRGLYFPLINKKDAALHTLLESSMVGGPSIIFHRYHEVVVTKIRENSLKENAKMTQTISGYDANALYLWALMQEIPTGYYAVRRASNNFRRETLMYYSTVCAEWLDCLSVLNKITIDHYLNTDYEKRIGPRRLPVDENFIQYMS